MSDGKEHTNKEMKKCVISHFNLSESDINEKTESGKVNRVDDRVNWTIQYFRRSLLIETVKRGFYKITPRGLEVFREDIDELDEKYLNRFPEYREFQKPKKIKDPKITPTSPPVENKNKKGFVYYIQEEMDGNIKIGWSEDPLKRLSEHQTSNSRELRMLVYVKGDKDYEKEIHRKFQSSKTTGEWFKPDKRLLVHIEKERSKFFEIVQNLSDDYNELKERLEKLENQF